MSIVLNGTTGITTPDVTSDGALKIDASAPDNSLVVDASGNLGIGSTNPNAPIDVKSNSSAGAMTIRARAANDYSFLVFRQADGTEDLGGIANQRTAANTGNLLFYTANGSAAAERARITSDGKLLVGTTTSNPGNGNNDIGTAMQGSTGFYGCREPANYCVYLNSTALDGSNRANYISFGLYGTNNIGAIHASGFSTVYATSSDYRLKENVTPLTGSLNKVLSLNPVAWKWKDIEATSQGFIAHELQEIVPECVNGEKDEVDAEGKPVYQGVDTSFLVATLTAAIQEQQAIIDDLTARVSALEASNV